MEAKIGDFVSTKRNSFRGRIYSKSHTFKDLDEDMDWFNKQRPILSLDTLHEPWYSILISGGGAISVPESDIMINHLNDRGNYNNKWDKFYFHEEPSKSNHSMMRLLSAN